MIFVERKTMTARGPVVYQLYFFEELVQIAGGPPERTLPKDLACHALWYYYCLASRAIKIEKACLVLETEPSPRFRPRHEARQLAQSIADMYGITLYEMTKFWPAIEKQRRAMGYTSNADLPPAYQFKFS